MPTYLYWARNNKGEHLEGDLKAPSEDAAISQLSQKGIFVTRLKDEAEIMDGQAFIANALGFGRPKLEDLLAFSQQMCTMMRAGVPIIRSIQIISDSIHNKNLKEGLVRVSASLEGGKSLAAAMQAESKIFPNLVVAMIHVGEETGNLEGAFSQIGFYLQNEIDTQRRIKSATRYPTFVIVAVVAAIAVINIFVIPAFEQFFSKFGGDLPFVTQILIYTSDFTVTYWPLMLIGIIGIVVGFKLWKKSINGQLAWGKAQLQFPIIGPILERALLARFCRSFSMTLSSGVPMLQSLTVVARAVDNAYISSKIFEMRAGLEKGESLVRTAKNSNMFTPLVMQMLAIGEETGDVDGMLKQVAETYESEVDYALKGLSEAIEPILISFIALIVLVLALGIFLPMWDLSSVAMKDMQG